MQHLHSMLLNLAISLSNLPDKISSLSTPTSVISRYLRTLECDVEAGRLKKTWKVDGRRQVHGFMYLVNAINGDSEDPNYS